MQQPRRLRGNHILILVCFPPTSSPLLFRLAWYGSTILCPRNRYCKRRGTRRGTRSTCLFQGPTRMSLELLPDLRMPEGNFPCPDKKDWRSADRLAMGWDWEWEWDCRDSPGCTGRKREGTRWDKRCTSLFQEPTRKSLEFQPGSRMPEGKSRGQRRGGASPLPQPT